MGIGTTSPDKQVHIESSTGGTIRLSSSDTTVGAGESLGEIDWYSNDGSGSGSGVRAFINVVENDGGLGRAYDMTFGTGNVATATEAMRIDSNGNLGIGTTSPVSDANYTGLTLSGSTGSQIVFQDDGATEGLIWNSNALNIEASSTNPTVFRNNGSEAMRIDSSGNLLVGTTRDTIGDDSGTNTNGSNIFADGTAVFGKNGNRPLIVNRGTNDGDLVQLKKDGSTVGSISSKDGSNIIIGSNDCALSFQTGTVRPRTAANGTSNGVNDLGTSDSRFKDLYLSGGVYLGGVGSANHLQDYEEGTYTPLIKDTAGSSTTFDTTLSYTKIGRMVYVYGRVQVTAETLGSTATHLYINLPFTPSGAPSQGSVYLYNANSDNGNQFVVWVISTAGDGVRIVDPTNNALTYSDNTEIVVGTNLTFSFMYEAA